MPDVSQAEAPEPTQTRLQTIAVIALLSLLPAAAMAQDRPPNPVELAKIEITLTDAGYTSWEEIELDDGLWEVDDALKGDDPTEYDIKIDPETWTIVRERVDD